MSDLNRVSITGRLGRDPEIRSMSNGNRVANFSVAVSERWRDKNSGEKREKTEWVNCAVFSDGLVGVIEQYLRKGSRVLVEGRFQTRSWEDQSGTKKYSTEVVLQGFDSKLIMLDNRQEGQSGMGQDPQAPLEGQQGGGGPSGGDWDAEILFAPLRLLP